MVEILNVNDNMPYFLEGTIQPRYISEVNSGLFVLFTDHIACVIILMKYLNLESWHLNPDSLPTVAYCKLNGVHSKS